MPGAAFGMFKATCVVLDGGKAATGAGFAVDALVDSGRAAKAALAGTAGELCAKLSAASNFSMRASSKAIRALSSASAAPTGNVEKLNTRMIAQVLRLIWCCMTSPASLLSCGHAAPSLFAAPFDHGRVLVR